MPDRPSTPVKVPDQLSINGVKVPDQQSAQVMCGLAAGVWVVKESFLHKSSRYVTFNSLNIFFFMGGDIMFSHSFQS